MSARSLHGLLAPLFVLILPLTVRAEAGLSEIARAKALWLRRPYALLESGDKSLGPDKVDLILARDATPDEWISYEAGIMSEETLAKDIVRIALTPRFVVAELSGSRGFAVLDLDLEEAGVEFVRPGSDLTATPLGIRREDLTFSTFEDLHWERVGRPWLMRCAAYAAMLGVIAIVVIIAIARRARGRPGKPIP